MRVPKYNSIAPDISSRVIKLKCASKTRWFKLVSGLFALILAVPLVTAFEAHMVNVTAEFAQIDPPILTPPGNVPIGDTTGGVDLTGTITVDMTHEDPDGTHIFYTFGPGTDPNTIPDPACGNSGANGGGGAIGVGQSNIITLSFNSDTTIKAITCDGATNDAHKSIINIMRYFFKTTPPPGECQDDPFSIPNGLVVLGAGDGNGKSDVAIGSIVKIKGNAHSNNNIGPLMPPLTRSILGNASAGGTVSPTISVSGTSTNGAPDVSLPTINQAFWNTQAKNGGEIPGDVSYAANSSDITLGPVSILGDLEISSNNDVTLTGPLHVGGKLTIHSNVDIHQHASQAGKYSLIIVDGRVDINPNVQFIHVGTGAFLIVSNTEPQAGANASIEVGANSNDQRIVILATKGDARIHSNGHVAAVFALNGFNNSDPAVRLEPNSIVEGGSLPELIDCGENGDGDGRGDDDCPKIQNEDQGSNKCDCDKKISTFGQGYDNDGCDDEKGDDDAEDEHSGHHGHHSDDKDTEEQNSDAMDDVPGNQSIETTEKSEQDNATAVQINEQTQNTEVEKPEEPAVAESPASQ